MKKWNLALSSLAFLSFFPLAACRSRNFGEDIRSSSRPTASVETGPFAKYLSLTGDEPTWTFTWTDSPEAAQNPSRFIASKVSSADACKGSFGKATSEAACEEDFAGPGLYVVSDPFLSRNSGHTLVAVPLKPKVPLLFAMDFDNEETIDKFSGISLQARSSGAAGIVFPAKGFAYPPIVGTTAVVVRDPAAVQVSDAWSLDTRASGSPFSRHEPFSCTPVTPVKSLLTAWYDHFEFLHLAASRDFSQASGLTQDAHIAAVISEMQLQRGAIQQKLQSIKETAPRLKGVLNNCSEKLPVPDEWMCLNRAFVHALMDDGDDVPLDELVAFFKSSGQLPDAKSPGTQAQLKEELIANWKTPEGIKRVEEAVGCARIAKENLGKYSIETWAEPRT